MNENNQFKDAVVDDISNLVLAIENATEGHEPYKSKAYEDFLVVMALTDVLCTRFSLYAELIGTNRKLADFIKDYQQARKGD